MAGIHPRAPGAKVFWFFSSEKNNLDVQLAPVKKRSASRRFYNCDFHLIVCIPKGTNDNK